MILMEGIFIPVPNFWLAAFAGFVGAYLLLLVGYWFAGHFGLVRIDMAESGKRYLGGDLPGWWTVGVLSHFLNGALLGELYAAVFYPVVALWNKGFVVSTLSGIAYGGLIWLILLNLVAMPFSGAGVFGRNTGSARLAITTLAFHIIYGFILGAIYREW